MNSPMFIGGKEESTLKIFSKKEKERGEGRKGRKSTHLLLSVVPARPATMRIVGLLFLLLLPLVSTTRHTFLFASTTRDAVLVFDNSGQVARPLNVIYQENGQSIDSHHGVALLGSRQQLFFSTAMATRNGSDVLSLSLGIDNHRQWSSWPYARITNQSLVMSTTQPAGTGKSTTISCVVDPSDLFLCQSSSASRIRRSDSSDREFFPSSYRLALDLSQPRSFLPPSLYALMTSGAKIKSTSAASVASAPFSGCLTLDAYPLLPICASARSYFRLSPRGDAETAIVLGSSFLFAHYAALTIDGLGQQVMVEASVFVVDDPTQVALRYILLSLAFLLVYVWARWGAGPSTMSLSLNLALHFEERRRKWPLDKTSQVASLAVVLIALMVFILSWTCMPSLLVAENAGLVGFVELQIFLQLFNGGLLIFSTAIFFVCHVGRLGHDFVDTHTTRSEMVWAYHASQVALQLGLILQAINPIVAVTGGVNSGRVVLLCNVVLLSLLLYFTTYFALGGLIQAFGLSARIIRTRFKIFVLCYAFWWLSLFVVGLWFVIGPIFDSASPLYDTAGNFMAAVVFESIAVCVGVWNVHRDVMLVAIHWYSREKRRFREMKRKLAAQPATTIVPIVPVKRLIYRRQFMSFGQKWRVV